MNITVIYATGRRAQSSTYNLARLLICELLDNGRLFEFQLPKDMPHICMGCYACIRGQEQKCGGSAALAPILAAMEQSELLIFCAPTYVFHVPGQMKTLLDHFAYRWMVHRPDLSFMKKQAVIINTAAGGGTRSTTRELKDSTDYWGIAGPIFSPRRCGITIGRTCPRPSAHRRKPKVRRTARRVRRCAANLTPSFKVKCLFTLYQFLHRKQKMSAVDDAYWQEQGYTTGKPWQ